MKRTAEFTLGLIGGILGIIFGFVALTVGGVGSAFNAGGAGEVIGLAWAAILLSAAAIVGAAIVHRHPKFAGTLLTGSAIGGVISISMFYIVPFILLIIAGLMALLRGNDKAFVFKKWWFYATFVVMFALVLGLHHAGDTAEPAAAGDSAKATVATADNQQSGDNINKISNVHFSDTSGKQTTQIDQAYIKDISAMNATDENFKTITYALIIHLTIKNDAPNELSTFPDQGHIVLPNGRQITGTAADDNLKGAWDSSDDIASGAHKSGNIYFPLTKSQAKSIKNARYKFEVICGDDNLTDKNYDVALKFK